MCLALSLDWQRSLNDTLHDGQSILRRHVAVRETQFYTFIAVISLIVLFYFFYVLFLDSARLLVKPISLFLNVLYKKNIVIIIIIIMILVAAILLLILL